MLTVLSAEVLDYLSNRVLLQHQYNGGEMEFGVRDIK